MTDNKEIAIKAKETALKLLDCAGRAAENSAARGNTEEIRNVEAVVESALKLLDYCNNYG